MYITSNCVALFVVVCLSVFYAFGAFQWKTTDAFPPVMTTGCLSSCNDDWLPFPL